MAALRSDRVSALDRPMSVEQIVASATHINFDENFPMRNWVRTADLMVKQANVYEHEGNDQMAYFLLYRHAHLILEHLPRHPQAKDVQYRQQLAQARRVVQRSLAKLEVLKPRINRRYEHYQAKMQSRRLRQEAEMHIGYDGQARPATPEAVSAEANGDAAVELANRHAAGRGSYEERDYFADMQRVREQIDRNDQSRPQNSRTVPHTTYHYPSFPAASGPVAAGLPPARPPKHALPQLPAKVPPVPPKTPSSADVPATAGAMRLPSFASSAQTESGEPLRPLFLPTSLQSSFLKIAQANTERNIETCGILCGILLRNALFVTHLVVPTQTGTSDTCEMTNEEELDAWIDEASTAPSADDPGKVMMVLGWIHTHPSQTAFLSSRDLHTHVWYQVSLPESIAVVCAPRQRAGDDYRVMRLTDPPGLPVVRTCKRSGFHPHDETSEALYRDCNRRSGDRPGHVVEHQHLEFSVVDLRKRL